MAQTPLEERAPNVDVRLKYVAVKEVSADGNVRFDFAIGWPELSVELALPQTAFDEFCRRNCVLPMPAVSPEEGKTT